MENKLKDIALIQTGVYGKTIPKGDIVYLQAKHFSENGQLSALLHPDLKSDSAIARHILKSGDVLFSAKGVKNFATVYESHNPAAVASTSFLVIRLTVKDIAPEYVAWHLNHPNTQKILKGKAIGTAIASISKATLEDIAIAIPPLQIQQKILQIQKLRNQELNIQTKIQELKEQYIQQQLLNALR